MSLKIKLWLGSVLLITLVARLCVADTLQHVIIVSRHGVRAPTWTSERLRRYSAEPWPDFGVPPGYLTPHGSALMKLLGSYYRELYEQQGLLTTSGCENADRIYFRADTDQRTIESARALSEALLPGCKLEIHSEKPGVSDSLFDPIEAGTAKPDPNLTTAALNGRVGPQLSAVVESHRLEFQLLQRVLNGAGKPAQSLFDEPLALKTEQNAVTLTGPLSIASTLTQNLLLEYANGMSGTQFGWGRLTASDLQQLLILHTAYAELMRRTPYLAQARGSNLLDHVVRTLEQAASHKRVSGSIGPLNSSITVISGHDTNISNLSGLLALSWALPSHQPDDVPPGGALIFSLWKSPTGEKLVRLQFVAQSLEQMHDARPLSLANPPLVAKLFVPGCSRAQEGYPCSWTDFRTTAQKAILLQFVNR
ncbi:MAG TPA: histidine-type phosphatase [Pyrinomonadaceae bacterium]|nr:histidine-type phosphatase [Pyrinomonadaceae bacterium]